MIANRPENLHHLILEIALMTKKSAKS